MPERDIVVIGASAGGVDALAALARALPADFPGSVLVALHLSEGGTSALAEILGRAGPLPAATARDAAPIEPGTIVVAPPGRHVVVEPGRTRVVRGPRVNGHRPSVDVLFHSAARVYGSRVVGVVLSGSLSDGALGLRAIKRRGGGAVVQSDAVHPGMPTSALQHVDVDCAVPLLDIPGALTMLMATREESQMDDEQTELEAGFDLTTLSEVPGDPSGLTCPECGGALWELRDGELRGYACHVGHTFSVDSLVEEHAEYVERALWTAVRILEERRALVLRLAERMDAGGQTRSARRFTEQAAEADAHADAIRTLIERASTADEAPDLDTDQAA